MKIIDLSKTIAYRKTDPWFMRIKIKNKSHRQSRFLIRRFLKLPGDHTRVKQDKSDKLNTHT